MSKLTVSGSGDSAKFVYPITITGSGDTAVTLNTKNTFVDKDIEITTSTPAAADPGLTLTDNTSEISMGSATNGYYNPSVTISGNATIASAGWITAGNHAVSDEVIVGKVAQSTMDVDNTIAASGDNIIPDAENTQVLTIGAGYYGSDRTINIKAMADGQAAEVSSADVTINSLTPTYNSTSGKFDIDATATIAAPSIDTAGYISSTVGTKNAGTATVAAEMNKVTLGVEVSDTTKVTPVLAREAISINGVVDAASGAGTTTAPSSGAYVKVAADGIETSVSATAKVTAAGYGTTTNYAAGNSGSITVGSNDAADLYVPIAAGAVTANGATVSSVSFTYDNNDGNFDIAGSANIPAPTVGTAGYVGNNIGTVSGLNNGAAVAATVNKVGIAASVGNSSLTVTPVISKDGGNVATAGTATTSQPASGHYITVSTAAISASTTATAAVTSAGYGTTTSGQYTDNSSATITAGANASATTYIPVGDATFANSGTQNVTYSDISSTAPVLISNDYLYVNAGYTDNIKISLAKLVPDQASADLAATYILSGYAAYDNDGKLVAGSIATYDGTYTVS